MKKAIIAKSVLPLMLAISCALSQSAQAQTETSQIKFGEPTFSKEVIATKATPLLDEGKTYIVEVLPFENGTNETLLTYLGTIGAKIIGDQGFKLLPENFTLPDTSYLYSFSNRNLEDPVGAWAPVLIYKMVNGKITGIPNEALVSSRWGNFQFKNYLLVVRAK